LTYRSTYYRYYTSYFMLWETSWYLLIAPHWRWCLLQWELKLIPSIQYNTGGFTGTNGTILQYMIYMYIYSTYGNMRQRPSVSAWQGAQKNPKELPQQCFFVSILANSGPRIQPRNMRSLNLDMLPHLLRVTMVRARGNKL
jgi:hypothetical protein